MKLDYSTTTTGPDRLRTLHIVVVEGEILSTTRAKEILTFVKNRKPSKFEWKMVKEAVRKGEQLKIL